MLSAARASARPRRRDHRRLHRRPAGHGRAGHRIRPAARGGARRRIAATHMLNTHRPLRVAVLCSHRAPGLMHLLEPVVRIAARAYEIVCMPDERARHSPRRCGVERRGVPVLVASDSRRSTKRSGAVALSRPATCARRTMPRPSKLLAPYLPDLILLDGYLLSGHAAAARGVPGPHPEPALQRSDAAALPDGAAAVSRAPRGARRHRGRMPRDARHGPSGQRASPTAGAPIVRSWPFPVSPLVADCATRSATGHAARRTSTRTSNG